MKVIWQSQAKLKPEMNFVWVLGIETIDVMIVYNIQASNLYEK